MRFYLFGKEMVKQRESISRLRTEVMSDDGEEEDERCER
jgi:hypothetical protein